MPDVVCALEVIPCGGCICRAHCQKELQRIAERTTERMRLLTLCSTAANNGRLYDKSAIHRLSECTAWINRAKDAVAKAFVLAARNTRLTNAPVRSNVFGPVIGLNVVAGCLACQWLVANSIAPQFAVTLLYSA